MKHCNGCNLDKPLSDFGKKNNGLQPRCKECQRVALHKHYIDNKSIYRQRSKVRKARVNKENAKRVIQYLQEHPCVDCGERDIIVLEFDHVRGTKYKNISKMVADGMSWETILLEIAKCDIRCANDHMRRHRRNATIDQLVESMS